MSLSRLTSAPWLRVALLPACLLLGHCASDDAPASHDDHEGEHDGGQGGRDAHVDDTRDGARPGDDDGGTSGPSIAMRLTAPSALPRSYRAAIVPGAAWADGLKSLKYLIRSVQICESMDAMGSGFSNPQGCLELYRGDESLLPYELNDDFTHLGDEARALETGYVDLLSPSERASLSSDYTLTSRDAREYHYGIITWALPIKFTATVSLVGGGSLYSHDGESRSELVGADMFRSYYTAPSTTLAQAPAEEAVVLLGNGGNWFKFQSPLVVSAGDIDAGKSYVLDLVFNPDGIVKGYQGDYGFGALREDGVGGGPTRTMTVPMLDLAPVPHRADQFVVRESYQGELTVDGTSFDVRFELYSVEGDDSGTIYGVDAKTLVNDATTNIIPELSKISFLDSEADGSVTFSSWKHTPIVTGFRHAAAEGDVVDVSLACAQHDDRAGAEGGSAIVVNRCPSANIPVSLTLRSRRRLEGGAPIGGGVDADAGVDAGGLDSGDLDAGDPDAGDAGDLDAATDPDASDAAEVDAADADAGND